MDEFTALFSRKDMTFEEAVAYFKERVPVTASRFYQIAAEYRALAFTVSGYTKAQVLKKFYDELLAALEEGNSLAEFRENMNDFLEAEGYGYAGAVGVHPADHHSKVQLQFRLQFRLRQVRRRRGEQSEGRLQELPEQRTGQVPRTG